MKWVCIAFNLWQFQDFTRKSVAVSMAASAQVL